MNRLKINLGIFTEMLRKSINCLRASGRVLVLGNSRIRVRDTNMLIATLCVKGLQGRRNNVARLLKLFSVQVLKLSRRPNSTKCSRTDSPAASGLEVFPRFQELQATSKTLTSRRSCLPRNTSSSLYCLE